MRMRRNLRSNTHVEDFTEHLFLFHWRDVREGGGIKWRDVRGVTNGWSGSGGAAISLLGSFGVLRSVGRRGSTLRLAGLRTRLPSTRVGRTGAAVLRGTGRSTVGKCMRLVVIGCDHARSGGRAKVTIPLGHAPRLTISHHAAPTRGREIASRRVIHRAVDITAGDTGSSGLLHADLVALGNLALQLLSSNLTTLSERDIERLGANHFVVHLSDSLGGLLGTGVANKTKALGMVLVVTHHFGASDGTERFKLCA